ncbi:MAG: TolC family protein [Bacteroidales bacterium]|nr:TolC family protein [Bacteroidales bacterium]
MKKMETIVLLLALASCPGLAQTRTDAVTLTLDECRARAVENNKEIEQARTQVEMAGYDRKIALAQYFPSVSATGAYMYNSRDIALISDIQSAALLGAGGALQDKVTGIYNSLFSTVGDFGQRVVSDWNAMQTHFQAFMQGNPELAAQLMQSPTWQALMQMMGQIDPEGFFGRLIPPCPDVATPVNGIAGEIDQALHPDLRNVWIGAVSVRQPVFVGGKIIYSNQMARLAQDLVQARYDQRCADVISDVDQAYWQIVSVAAKCDLAQAYAELLRQMEKDVDASVEAGVLTQSDALQIRVKVNEADMMATKARNGLSLSRMLLCQRIGLPLETEIRLADEGSDVLPRPQAGPAKDFESVCADRPETRSLDLAARIYDRKAKVVRADMLPQVALTANYLISNPNLYNGFQKDFAGMFNAGVVVNVPLFHAFEANNKYRKAKAEATLYRSQLTDAREKIELQVTRQRKLLDEALEKLGMAETNLSQAEENLRVATIGFEEGVIPTHAALAAQTAWLQAHSEYIDAGTELQVAASGLAKAEGNYPANE